jgi:hypothetical protein
LLIERVINNQQSKINSLMNPPADFSLAGLYAAIDRQRQARGLTWQQAVLEINMVFGRISSRPISRSTVTGLRTKAVAEGDGVLAMLKWLNRTPESFLPGVDGADVSGANRLPDVPPASGLRFETKKLHAALNVQRVARGLTWQQVGREIGLGAATLTHLSKGGRTGFPHVMRITRWLGRPVAQFTRASRW